MIKPAIFNIDTLAEKAGVSRRTIHYYLQRGLLMPPHGEGRGCHYGQEHLDRLREVQNLSEQGLPLVMIKEYFDHGNSIPSPMPEEKVTISQRGESWERIGLALGIEVHFKTGVVPEELKNAVMQCIEAEVRKHNASFEKEEKS